MSRAADTIRKAAPRRRAGRPDPRHRPALPGRFPPYSPPAWRL